MIGVRGGSDGDDGVDWDDGGGRGTVVVGEEYPARSPS